MSYKLTKFGTTELPAYNAVSDVSTGGVQSLLTRVIGGWFDGRGETRAAQEPGALTKRFLIHYDPDQIDDTFRALRGLHGKRDRLYREWRDGIIEWCWARCVRIPGTRQPRHNLAEATIEFERISPVWHTAYHGAWFFDDGNYFDSGLNFDSSDLTGSLSIGSNNVTCPNDGNADSRHPIITITGGSGADITQIRMECYDLDDPDFTVNQRVTWVGAFGDTDILIIDCGKQSVTFNGSPDYDNLTINMKPGWLKISPGGVNMNIIVTGVTPGSPTTYDVAYWEASI